MSKKAQFSTLGKVVIAVIIFVMLVYFILLLFGALPTPKEIFKSLFNIFIP